MMSLHFGSCMPMRRIRTLFRWLFEIWSNHNIIFCHIRLSIYINHDISDEIDGLSRLWCGWKFITDRTRVEMYRNREMINCCLTSFLSGFRSDEFISQRSSLCSKISWCSHVSLLYFWKHTKRNCDSQIELRKQNNANPVNAAEWLKFKT